MDYVLELFDEQKDQVAVEQILRVVFLDPERPSPDNATALKMQLGQQKSVVDSLVSKTQATDAASEPNSPLDARGSSGASNI